MLDRQLCVLMRHDALEHERHAGGILEAIDIFPGLRLAPRPRLAWGQSGTHRLGEPGVAVRTERRVFALETQGTLEGRGVAPGE